MVAISACLTGSKCRYNGTDTLNESLLACIGQAYISICPEVLAGFSTPRLPCEIIGGSGEDVLDGKARIVDASGTDITEQMIRGATKALTICQQQKVSTAYMQPRSPTCGCGLIYDGTFTETLKKGVGVFSALLLRNGITVIQVSKK